VTLPRLLFSSLLGRRLSTTSGSLEVPGLEKSVSIRRDRWGIPHIDASNDRDAWYAVGFCHGQDRAFQLETLLRVIRGTLSELVGKDGIAMDRLSRRTGFSRGAEEQLKVINPDIQAVMRAYAAGVTAGASMGLKRKPHEFSLLASKPTAWEGADVVGMARLQSFLFATNADAELARLKILITEGPEVLSALDPYYGESWGGAFDGGSVGQVVDRLSEDLDAFARVLGRGGASNSWAVSAGRTQTGRPILANDPHLPALLPSPWYLIHVGTPEWSAAGATLVGGPAVVVGHNGYAAWGITAALFDNTDLFQEQMGADGTSVRNPDGFVQCPVVVETIKVRGGRSIHEEVVITPRGPIVGPAFDSGLGALSLKVFWLQTLPLEGFLKCHKAQSFEEFRSYFAKWPAPDLNVTYADASGTIGWQLVGAAPRRLKGWGTIPRPGWEPGVGWETKPVPFDQMPYLFNPDTGYLATANTRPHPDVAEPFLGVDWIDGYRLMRIMELLGARKDWDLASTQAMQLDQESLPWREMRDVVMTVPDGDPDTKLALELLQSWDGKVAVDSAGATIFEFFAAEMAQRVAMAKAPKSMLWVLGRGFGQLLPYTTFSFRRLGHLIPLMHSRPKGWFDHPWEQEMAEALAAVTQRLRASLGEDPKGWTWGRARPITLKHPIAEKKPVDRFLGPLFNIGPFPWGGDSNTIAQTSVDPLNPTSAPAFIASLRMVIDVGEWEQSRFVIPGGQSGNPLSDHYQDQMPLWQAGEGVPIPFAPEEVANATIDTLMLEPAGPA
jgi:penicillin amidase